MHVLAGLHICSVFPARPVQPNAYSPESTAGDLPLELLVLLYEAVHLRVGAGRRDLQPKHMFYTPLDSCLPVEHAAERAGRGRTRGLQTPLQHCSHPQLLERLVQHAGHVLQKKLCAVLHRDWYSSENRGLHAM